MHAHVHMHMHMHMHVPRVYHTYLCRARPDPALRLHRIERHTRGALEQQRAEVVLCHEMALRRGKLQQLTSARRVGRRATSLIRSQ